MLVMLIGCSFLRPSVVAEAEKADGTPSATVTSTTLSLNGEPMGGSKDLRQIGTKLSDVIKYRKWEGIFFNGSKNRIADAVFLVADEKLALGTIGDIVRAISGMDLDEDYLRDTDYRYDYDWEKDHPRARLPCGKQENPGPSNVKPNPLLLAVRTENAPGDWFPMGEIDLAEIERISCIVSFHKFEDRGHLLRTRALFTLIEISADDRLFINTKMNRTPNSEDKIILDQKPLPDSDVAQVLNDTTSPIFHRQFKETGEHGVMVIASEKASYASLLKLLSKIEQSKMRVSVKIRPEKLPKALNPR